MQSDIIAHGIEQFLDVLLLLVGWLLGVVSFPITEKIRERTLRKRLVPALHNEMMGLEHSLILCSGQLRDYLGSFDDDFANWALSRLERCSCPAPHGPAVDNYRRLLAIPFDGRKQMLLGPLPPNSNFRVATFDLPFVESNISDLKVCSHDFQQRVLNIASLLRTYNAEAGSVNEYRLMTFDGSLAESQP